MTGNYTFPATGLGPNGFGGLSSIRLFVGDQPTGVPETGSTVMFLGVGLLGIAMAKSLITRKAVGG